MSDHDNSSIYGEPPATITNGHRTPSPTNSGVSSQAFGNPAVQDWPSDRREMFATSNRVPSGDGEAATSPIASWTDHYPRVRFSRDPDLQGLPNSRFLAYMDAFVIHIGYQGIPARTAREAFNRFVNFVRTVEGSEDQGNLTRMLARTGLFPIFERIRGDIANFVSLEHSVRASSPASVPATIRPAAGRQSISIPEQIAASSGSWQQWNNPREEAERREDMRQRDVPPHRDNYRFSAPFPNSTGYIASPVRPVAVNPNVSSAYNPHQGGSQGQPVSGNTSYHSFRETPPSYDTRNVTYRRTSAAPALPTIFDSAAAATPTGTNYTPGDNRPPGYNRTAGSPTPPRAYSRGADYAAAPGASPGPSGDSSSNPPSRGPPGRGYPSGPPGGGGFPNGPPGGGGYPGPHGGGPPHGNPPPGPPGGNPPPGPPGNPGGAPYGGGAPPPPPPPGGPHGGGGFGGPPDPPGGPFGGNGAPPVRFGFGGVAPVLPPGRTVDQEIQREAKKDLRKPKPFDGSDRSKFDSYVTDLNMLHFAKPVTYFDDREKIILGASYLKEDSIAQKHWTNLIRHHPNHPALSSWNEWLREFGGRFGLVNREVHAQRAIRKMRMKKEDHFPDFLVQFDGSASDTRWNDHALADALLQSLPLRLLDMLALRPRPRDYLELREVLDQLDFRYWESEQDKDRWKEHNPAQSTYSPKPRFANNTRYGNSSQNSRDTRNSGSRDGQSNSSDSTAARATYPNAPSSGSSRSNPESRQWVDDAVFQERRSKGLCGICGGNDHNARDQRHRGQQVYGRAVITLNADGEEVFDFFEYEAGDDPDDQEPPGEESSPSQGSDDTLPGPSDANV